MQGIAGFFKNVIKPYSVPTNIGHDVDTTKSASTADVADPTRGQPGPEVNGRMKNEVPTKTVIEHDNSLNDMREMVYDRISFKGLISIWGKLHTDDGEERQRDGIVRATDRGRILDFKLNLIKDIRDPEKPNSLEDLDVVSEKDVCVCKFNQETYLVQITFVPTVPHCSLASLIGLCLRQKLIQDFPEKHKLDIFIKDGSHETAEEVTKQINDKERIAAALENPNLRELVDQCINNDFG